MRTLIGAVAYRDLCDYSAAGVVLDRLSATWWPPDIAIEDVSYNPIAVAQRLQEEPPGRQFDRLVLIGSVARPGRRAGTVAAYRWDGALPAADVVQAAVAEAVTGVISLDNTLMLLRQFGALPKETIVVEIEPATHGFGDALSAPVARAVDEALSMIPTIAGDDTAVRRLPECPLGGGRLLQR